MSGGTGFGTCPRGKGKVSDHDPPRPHSSAPLTYDPDSLESDVCGNTEGRRHCKYVGHFSVPGNGHKPSSFRAITQMMLHLCHCDESQ